MAQSLQVKNISWWHERFADWMLANPELTLGDAAKHFNCTRTHLSIIKNSDAFKIYWATRSGDFSNALVDKATDTILNLKDKAAAVTELALDELNRRIELAPEAIGMDTLIDISQMGLKSLGYGAKAAQQSPTVNVNIATGLVSAEDLAKARARALESYGVKAQEPAEPKASKAPIDHQAEILEEL